MLIPNGKKDRRQARLSSVIIYQSGLDERADTNFAGFLLVYTLFFTGTFLVINNVRVKNA